MNFNKIVVVGNLTRDPEARSTTAGQPVASFGIATNRVWTNQEGEKQQSTEFHNVVAFGKLADICSRYLNKGRLVLIEGRIQTRSWQDQGGNKKYWTEIIAENMQMGPRPGSEGGSAPADPESDQPAGKPKTDNLPSQEEIPVIEADEPLQEDEKTDTPTKTNKKKQGVDPDDIPF